MTEGGFIVHTNKNSRGRGCWKKESIVVGLIHHGDWRCLRVSAVGFALGSTSGVVGGDKTLE